MNKTLSAVVARAVDWPEAAQAELAELALEIEAELKAGAYVASRDELEGIARGLRDAEQGRFASNDDVEAVFAKHRRK
jgi:predicted transcriptional regulator